MVFTEKLTLRAPDDAELIALAANSDVLTAQKVAGHMRAHRADWRTVPVPDRMKHLPRDPRGYPVFAMAFRDRDGRPHFTINDTDKVFDLIERDCCAVCGMKLFRARWFIGGPRSAFAAGGTYVDPPMHGECAHYAVRVCPYLALPSYRNFIEARKLHQPALLFKEAAMHPDRPEIFVVVQARGHTTRHDTYPSVYLTPKRPYMRVEYWQHGRQLDDDVGAAICARIIDADARTREHAP
jgi:hypothetical protein